MTFSTMKSDYFEGGSNLTKGQRKSLQKTLAELFRKERRGRVAYNATPSPSNVAVAFDVPFEDLNYTVTGLSWEDNNGTVEVPASMYIAETTKAVTGFSVRLVAGGELNGYIHWEAKHD